MQKPWIKTAIVAGLFILPALGMAQATERHVRTSDSLALASHDGPRHDRHYDRGDHRRDYGYDRRDRHKHSHYDKKRKKKAVKAYRKGYKQGVRDSRRYGRRHIRSHKSRHHDGYRYGYRPHRVQYHYHRGSWGWWPCSQYHG